MVKPSYQMLLDQIVPVTVRVLVPGVTIQLPVVGSCVNVAAGTVICPGTVENSPVVSS